MTAIGSRPLFGLAEILGLDDDSGSRLRYAAIVPAPAPFLDPRSRRDQEERLGMAEATRERTKAMVERAQAQTAQAKKEFDRIRTLTETGSSTVQALERAETALRVANRELRAAEFQDHATEHEIEQAKALLARYGEGGNRCRGRQRWHLGHGPPAGLAEARLGRS